MDALTLLKSQHRKVESLFEEYRATSHRERKRELFEQIADNLAAHATIEEKIFYPAAYVGDLKDLLLEAVEEHLAVKRLIADLMALTPDDEHYDAKVKVLCEQITHHVGEEEEKLFPLVRKRMAPATLKLLGDRMRESFDEMMRDHPRDEVPGETDHASPLE